MSKNSSKATKGRNPRQKSPNNKSADGMPRERPNKYLMLPSASKVVADRFYTKLTFEGMGFIPIIAGNTYSTLRFQPSAAFDIDPLVGSTSTPGFAELAALYNNYRVTCSRATMRVANPSTTNGALLVVVPLNSDPGALAPANQANAWPDQPYSRQKMVGLLGSPPAEVTNFMSTEKIVGSENVYFDDTYASLVNGIPANNWYWGVGILCGAAVPATTNFTLQYQVDIGVEFYDRKVVVQ